jgi:hypothetical protein
MPGESLKGQTALVTGAARRIGRATALALADEGVNVAVHYHQSEDAANEVCYQVACRGLKAWPLMADLAVPQECENLIQRVHQAAGSLDILINNASIFPVETLQEATLESLVANARVNAWAPFVLSRAFRERALRGKIVNLLDSRIAGHDWSHVGYILSKHLLAVLTRMTALALAPHITVNAVAPGLILPPPGKDESYLERLKDTVPLKRYGSPEDVAHAILFLLKSDFITGQVIYVDGGRHLREPADGSHTD